MTEWNLFSHDSQRFINHLFHKEPAWYFVAIRIDSTQFIHPFDYYWTGAIEPVAFSFDTEVPVYPMRISAISAPQSTEVAR